MVTWALARYHNGTSELSGYAYCSKVDVELRDSLMARAAAGMPELNALEVGGQEPGVRGFRV